MSGETLEGPSAAAVADTWEKMMTMMRAQEEDILRQQVNATHDGRQEPILDKVGSIYCREIAVDETLCTSSCIFKIQNVPMTHGEYMHAKYHFNVC